MPHLLLILLVVSFCTRVLGLNPDKNQDLVLRYTKPADNGNEALPLGNGRLGAMVFGATETEHLQLNENTLYSGESSTAYTDIKISDEAYKKYQNRSFMGSFGPRMISYEVTGWEDLISLINPWVTCTRVLA